MPFQPAICSMLKYLMYSTSQAPTDLLKLQLANRLHRVIRPPHLPPSWSRATKHITRSISSRYLGRYSKPPRTEPPEQAITLRRVSSRCPLSSHQISYHRLREKKDTSAAQKGLPGIVSENYQQTARYMSICPCRDSRLLETFLPLNRQSYTSLTYK